MGLVHKSVYIRPEVWQQLRINAGVSGCSLRDYLTYLIQTSVPVGADEPSRIALELVMEANAVAASATHNSSASVRNITSELVSVI